jgi:uncharacterized protein (DUF433 family)
MLEYKHLITSDYKIMLGKPVIKGTRITVVSILQKLSEGASVEDLLGFYPHITSKQIMACIEFAADFISNEEIMEVA